MSAPTLEEHARRVVDAWPPLSPAQLDRLAVILRGRSDPEPPRPTREDRVAAYLGAALEDVTSDTP